MADIDDAISVTGATSGKVVSLAQATVALTAAQKTSLASFISSLGVWQGNPSHISWVNISRSGPNQGVITVSINGYIVHADAAAAVAQKSAGAVSQIIGAVP